MTEKTGIRAPKAYANREFLHSTEARPLRLLAEFLEPQRRFKQFDVKDTVVFFGSARTLEPQEADRRLADVQRRIDEEGASATLDIELARARSAKRMSHYYDAAVELARLLTAWSNSLSTEGRHFIVCSGGGPGIMEAANKGAALAGGTSAGLNISIPFEQAPNAYISEDLNFEFHYFFMRKFWFVYLAKALVAFPGGFGTLDELTEVITLLQTGKVSKSLPIVVFGTDYWKEVMNFEAMARWGTINPGDLDLIHFSDSAQEAFEYLKARLEADYLQPGQNGCP